MASVASLAQSTGAVIINLSNGTSMPPWHFGPLGQHSPPPADNDSVADMASSSVQQLRPSLLATIITTNAAGQTVVVLGDPVSSATTAPHVVLTLDPSMATPFSTAAATISSNWTCAMTFDIVAVSAASIKVIASSSMSPSLTIPPTTLLTVTTTTSSTAGSRATTSTGLPGVIGPELKEENRIVVVIATMGSIVVVGLSAAVLIAMNRQRFHGAGLTFVNGIKSIGAAIVKQYHIYMSYEASRSPASANKTTGFLGPMDLARRAVDDNLLLQTANSSDRQQEQHHNYRSPGMSVNGMQGMWM